jgi:signal recognition particle subunit SRP54
MARAMKQIRKMGGFKGLAAAFGKGGLGGALGGMGGGGSAPPALPGLSGGAMPANLADLMK